MLEGLTEEDEAAPTAPESAGRPPPPPEDETDVTEGPSLEMAPSAMLPLLPPPPAPPSDLPALFFPFRRTTLRRRRVDVNLLSLSAATTRPV